MEKSSFSVKRFKLKTNNGTKGNANKLANKVSLNEVRRSVKFRRLLC